MKNLKSFLVLILTVVMLPNVVFAQETTEVNSEQSLKDCVNVDAAVCTLTDNITLTSALYTTNTTTIDLNGHAITPNSTLKITGGLVSVGYNSKLTINDTVGTGSIMTSSESDIIYAAIQVANGTIIEGTKAELVINGGTIAGFYYGIVGNGTRHNTEVTVNGGTVKGLNTEDCLGIYNPQNGTLTINGGVIEGSTGIEVRAGNLVVNGGTITGTSVPVNVTPNGNGTTTTGAGIAIVQHTTKLSINVTITGGTIKGYSAFYEANAQKNDAASIDKIKLSIKGGNFRTINGGTATVYSEDKTAFISGGTYTTNVSEYIGASYTSKLVNETYTVGTLNTINVSKTTNGTVTADKSNAIIGEEVTLTITPDKGYEIKSITVVDADKKELTVKDNKFTMTNSNATVTVEFSKINYNVTVTTPVNGSVTVDKNKATMDEEVTLTITPDKGYEIKSITVVDADKKELTVKDNKFTMTNSNATVTVEFSKITVTAEIPVVDTTIEVKEPTVGTTDKTVNDILLNTLVQDEELKKVAETSSLNVEVNATKVEANSLDTKVVEAIKNTVSNATLAEFFDITIAVKNTQTDETIGTLKELTDEIELVILLPENLRNTNSDVNRKYYVIREHEGKVETVEAKLSADGKYLTFKSKLFSTYALAYTDEAVENNSEVVNPQTFDGISNYIILGTISMLVITASFVLIKKMN